MVARTTMICCLLVVGVVAAPSVAELPPTPVRPLVASFEVSWEVKPEADRLSRLIHFKDTSGAEPISWRWDFGDGSEEGTTQNPTHAYPKPSTYTVKLTVANRLGSTATKTQTFSVPLGVRFTVQPTTDRPLSIRCTDQSVEETGKTTIRRRWDFGDKKGTSAQQNPEHTYQKPGTYVVTLTITRSDGLTMSAVRKVRVPRA